MEWKKSIKLIRLLDNSVLHNVFRWRWGKQEEIIICVFMN